MDKSTKAELEAVRKQTPRYLFRLWSYGKAGEPPTGGHAGLNTETAITPIAFGNGKGHKSVYDMTREFFAEMVSRHLCVFHIETEFSSWSASLNYILSKCPGISSAGIRYSERDEDYVYVSVIDTEMLWETNQVFYVPLLHFLSAGRMEYCHEYLVHGVVRGPWYKAIPFTAFTTPRCINMYKSWHLGGGFVPCSFLNNEIIQIARKVGVQFGDDFALPMTLAYLCCDKREPKPWMIGVGSKDFALVVYGIKGLKIPASWKTAQTYTGHAISSKNFSDTKQLTRLIQDLIGHFKRYDFPSEQSAKDDSKSDKEKHLHETSVEVDLIDSGTENGGSNETEAVEVQSEEGRQNCKGGESERERETNEDTNAGHTMDSPRRKTDSPRRKERVSSLEDAMRSLEAATGSREVRAGVKARFERECKPGPEFQETLP